jgi:hypothetical protein
LTGLNFANNQITRDNLLVLTEELMANNVLQTLLLKNNPGLDPRIAHVLLRSIEKNRAELSAETTQDVVEHLEVRHASGRRRLEVQTPRIAALLRTWQQLQDEEVAAPQSLLQPSKHNGAGSTTSAATTGTASGAAARKRANGKSALPSQEKAPTPGTRRAAEVERHAQVTRPYGYSALDLVTDRLHSAPASPRRPASPTARENNTSYFSTSTFDTTAVANGMKEFATRHSLDLTGRTSESNPTGTSVRPAMYDFERLTGRILGTRGDDDSESVEDAESAALRGSTRGGAALSEHDDVLDHAVPMGSPHRKEGIDGALAIVRAELQAQAKDRGEVPVEVVGEGWGNVEWPVSDDAFDHPDPEGRPPSRISIRHRGGHSSGVLASSSGGGSPSPTQEMLLRSQRSLDEEYRRLLRQVQESTRSPRRSVEQAVRQSPNSPAQAPPRRTSPVRSSREKISSKPFPPTRPFYAGGSVPGASPPRPTVTTITNSEMAALYGPGRGIARPTAGAFAGRSAAAPPRKAPKSGKRAKKPRSSSRPAAMGRAQGPRGTRIRARSADRFQDPRGLYSAPSSAPSAYRGRPASAPQATLLDQSALAHELSTTVLNATKNLETVSAKLRDVIDTLSTSMDLNFSMQREIMNASALNTTATAPGGMNTSRATNMWTSPGTFGFGATPLSSQSRRGIAEARGSSPQTPLTGASSRAAPAQRYREHSASPAPYSAPYAEDAADYPGQHDEVQSAPHVDSQALADLVRSRMEMKLRSMFEPSEERV